MLQQGHLTINRPMRKAAQGASQKPDSPGGCGFVCCSGSGTVDAPSCFPASLSLCKTRALAELGTPSPAVQHTSGVGYLEKQHQSKDPI